MIDPDQDPTETVEYDHGFRWASQNGAQLIELYSSTDLSTQELRTRLWRAAEQFYRSKRGEMENEVRQTLFVMGAVRRLVTTMPGDRAGAIAIFEIGQELGSVYAAEKWKYVHFEALRKKDASWWRKKKGDASPNQVVNALATSWWDDHRDAKRTSKWEILIDQLGTREMCALATLGKITHNADDKYKTYDVDGDDCSFQVMADNVGEVIDGRYIVHQRAGEIVG